ncbi:MAG: DUF1292 domain-containing protein [Oscillospiraceae bacterium]|jgi:uncharacterized protein YrzB (UPF0473 family)|nr:DUF1292 domain-containing protein [Oscillospiraceae bacterium]
MSYSEPTDGGEFVEEEAEIVDLDGEPFVVVGELDYEGEIYLALIPYEEGGDDEEEEEEIEFVVLKETEENGERFLATVDDEEKYAKIGEMFLDLFEEEGEDVSE